MSDYWKNRQKLPKINSIPVRRNYNYQRYLHFNPDENKIDKNNHKVSDDDIDDFSDSDDLTEAPSGESVVESADEVSLSLETDMRWDNTLVF